MPDDIVYYVAVERTGIIWAGTSVYGLVRLDESLLMSVDETKKENSSVSLYPNPATNQITIYDLRFTIGKIEIFDSVGKNIFSQQPTAGSHPLTVSVSTLSPGIYFLRITSDEGTFTK